jgi:hypothetical protein
MVVVVLLLLMLLLLCSRVPPQGRQPFDHRAASRQVAAAVASSTGVLPRHACAVRGRHCHSNRHVAAGRRGRPAARARAQRNELRMRACGNLFAD